MRFFQPPPTSTSSATRSLPSLRVKLRLVFVYPIFLLSLSSEGKPKEKRGGETVRYTTVWPLLQPRGQPRGDSLFTECKSGFIWWLCVHRPRRGFLRSRSVRMDPPFTSVAERPLVCRLCRARESRMYVYIRDLRIPTDKKEPIAQGDFIGRAERIACNRAGVTRWRGRSSCGCPPLAAAPFFFLSLLSLLSSVPPVAFDSSTLQFLFYSTYFWRWRWSQEEENLDFQLPPLLSPSPVFSFIYL